MKKTNYYLILIILTTISLSCGNNSKNKNSDNKNNIVIETDLSGKNNQNKKEYIPNSDCKALFESIDFSSFCFSEDKTPKFEVSNNYGVSSRCQYKVYSDKDNFDFQILISTSADKFKEIITKIELNKKVLKSIGFNKITNLKNLGDNAYIAYNEDSQIKKIHITSNNMTIKIELSDIDKHKSCLFKDKELERLVKVILESL
ncbi:MAG: hypothetical protein JKX68_11875 [Flavobacteriales bacterium]|nr:hypothetical protein [Flavobacteriales bacterium]